MTIQISVTIWTVICFMLLMLILHFLLFKPVLKTLDERNCKIKAANDKKRENEEKIRQHAELLEQQKADYEKQKLQETKAAIKQIETQGKQMVEQVQEERMQKVTRYRASMHTEYEQILGTVSSKMDNVAEILAQKIISHRV